MEHVLEISCFLFRSHLRRWLVHRRHLDTGLATPGRAGRAVRADVPAARGASAQIGVGRRSLTGGHLVAIIVTNMASDRKLLG